MRFAYMSSARPCAVSRDRPGPARRGVRESRSNGYGLETLSRNFGLVKRRIGPKRQLVVMVDAGFTGETVVRAVAPRIVGR